MNTLVSLGAAMLLFLCAFLGYRKICDLQDRSLSLQSRYLQAQEEYLLQNCELQTKLDEAQQKLFDYMDLTRKEALDSYRRGLQDGMSVANQKNVYAPKSPVKTMDEHFADQQEAVTPPKPDPATTELLKGYANMMAYNGDAPKERGD